MSMFSQAVRNLVLLIARLGLGGVLILHGWRRWRELGVESQITYLEQFKTPYANFAAWGSIALELLGGILLVVGVLTPFVAAAVVAEQVLIICWTNYFNGWQLLNPDGTAHHGYEYNLILGVLALVFVAYGAGGISIDRIFRRKKPADGEDDLASSSSSGTSSSRGSSSI